MSHEMHLLHTRCTGLTGSHSMIATKTVCHVAAQVVRFYQWQPFRLHAAVIFAFGLLYVQVAMDHGRNNFYRVTKTVVLFCSVLFPRNIHRNAHCVGSTERCCFLRVDCLAGVVLLGCIFEDWSFRKTSAR